jgi:hypothetical protein
MVTICSVSGSRNQTRVEQRPGDGRPSRPKQSLDQLSLDIAHEIETAWLELERSD